MAKFKKKAPVGFYRFSQAVIQDIEIFKTKEHFYSFALGRMSSEEKKELIDFVADYNAGRISDEEMQYLWNRSETDFYIPDPAELRRFLTEAAEWAQKPLKRHKYWSDFGHR